MGAEPLFSAPLVSASVDVASAVKGPFKANGFKTNGCGVCFKTEPLLPLLLLLIISPRILEVSIGSSSMSPMLLPNEEESSKYESSKSSTCCKSGKLGRLVSESCASGSFRFDTDDMVSFAGGVGVVELVPLKKFRIFVERPLLLSIGSPFPLPSLNFRLQSASLKMAWLKLKNFSRCEAFRSNVVNL